MWKRAMIVSNSQFGLKAVCGRGEDLLKKIVAAGKMLGAAGKTLVFV